MEGALRTVALVSWNGSPDPLVRSATAALTLALLEPALHRAAARVEGTPVAGPSPTCGAALGRVKRPNGLRATWRLSWEQRHHHTFLAGASGYGKSTTLLRLVLDDLDAGRMVVLVDRPITRR